MLINIHSPGIFTNVKLLCFLLNKQEHCPPLSMEY